MYEASRDLSLHLLVLALFFGLNTCFAHGLRPAPMTVAAHALGQRWPVGDTVHVCAIRIEFVADDVTGTTGDGTMGSGFSDSLVIDPLPHNRTYFSHHLEFLKHYYQTVSKDSIPFERLVVYPEEEDSVYQVAYPMWHYNYNIHDDTLSRRLTELFFEALQLADPDVNFAHYDAVIIFHAGVGKDFNLGYDETPFDLPSAYITGADFQRYLPDHSAGFQTNDGVMVDRGLLLPEGESQDGFQLGLNGIMVKLFGNWLGLPDLFDTQTGRSGIGRWGMMDQGSGNVLALVPAMPEAWSRLYMGWEVPDTIWASANPETLRVSRFGLSDNAPEILLLPITETEYYLIENRAADPDNRRYVECRDGEGRLMHISLYGDTIAISPQGFGVITQADNYDFGIPGDGLLIWHIDEAKIQAGLANNTVNADPEHRGVDLVEADGSQDIGEEYGFGFAGGGTELGAPEDAWWDENDYHKLANGNVRQVAFNNTTFPAARTYDGAYSWYELSEFSAILPVMSFAITNRTRVPGFPLRVPLVLGDSVSVFPADFDGDGSAELILVGADSTVFIIDSTAALRPIALPAWRNMRVVDIDGDGQDELLLGANRLYIVRNLTGDSLLIDSSRRALREGIYNHLCAGVAPDSSARILAVWERDEPGNEYVFGLTLFDLFDGEVNLLETLPFPSDPIWHINGLVALDPPPSSSWAIGYEAAGQSDTLIAVDLSNEIEIRWRTGGSGLRPLACVATEAETLLWCEDGWRNRHSGELVREAACVFSYQILDWDGDGTPEVVKDGQACHLRSGSPVEEFPLRAPVRHIVAADFDGDLLPDLLGDDGRWHLFRHNLSEPPAFPMARLGDVRFIFHWDAEAHIEMATILSPLYCSDGIVRVDLRRITAGEGSGWRRVYGAYPDPSWQDPNPTHFYSIEPGIGAEIYARPDWVYPWPNPTNRISNIRLTLPYAARAHIRFFDIAGHLIDELSAVSTDPEPFDVPWDVSGVASGVYIGIVEVVGGGKTERAQIKVAVVK